MITLIFVDCECEYNNYIIIFFELLKNHIEYFGWLTKIDLTGIEIRKEEFDNVLKTYETFAKNNEISDITNERFLQIENYLMSYLEHDKPSEFMEYCVKYGKMDMLKYACEFGCTMSSRMCENMAAYGHFDCIEYAYENGCIMEKTACSSEGKYSM